jgi:hypothetical protein
VNISRGMVGYHPTTTTIEQHWFTGPNKLSMQSRFQFEWSSIDIGGGTTLEVRISTYHSPSHTKMLLFCLVVLPGLKFKSTSILYQILTILISLYLKRGPTCKWNQPLVFYHLSKTKHNTNNDTIYYKKR